MAETETTSRLELTPLVLTKAQVGTLLQVSEDTIENLHRTGQLLGHKIGKHLRWLPDDVREFTKQLAQKARG